MSNKMTEREERVELFKTLVAFGAITAAMFCIGGPLLVCFAPGLSRCFRYVAVLLGGIAGFLIVVCILVFYWSSRRDISPTSKPARKARRRISPSSRTTGRQT